MKSLAPILRSILNSYAGILFLARPWAGLGILILSFGVSPHLGISALVCVLSAYIFARGLGLKEDFLRLDYYIYNPLLVGLSIGYFFRVDLLSLLFLILMGIFTFLLTYALSSALGYYFRLPVLSLPFVIGSLMAALAAYHYSNLLVGSLRPPAFLPDISLPLWLEGFLRALGAIFFMPHPLAGLCLAILLFLFSRILIFLAFLGYFSGTLLAWVFTGSAEMVFANPNHFNFILAAMALGGAFLIPSPRSYGLALIAAMLAVPLTEASQIFWEKFGLPAFALPFNLVTLLFLYTLRISGYRWLTTYYRGTPEKTLDHHLTLEKRFPVRIWDLELPVSGRWRIWQGTDGRFTHKGPWRYALDFVITDEEGRTYRGEGLHLEDYYAYRKPIFSPITGRVVEVVDGFPDEPPGSANREHPWGNHLILYDTRGFYVLLAHFSPGTFQVKKGDWVVKGTLLGLCGSSGYSPEPHLHMHVQGTPEIGAPTQPFVFSAYITNGFFRDFALPQEGESVEPAPPERWLKQSLNFLLGQRLRYRVWYEGQEQSPLQIRVEMAPDGSFYLTDGRAKLFFAQRGGAFYFLHFEGSRASPLSYFFMAAPKIPLHLRQDLCWEDRLPLEILFSPLRKELYLFLLSFWPGFFKSRASYRARTKFDFEGRLTFNGKELLTRVKLAPGGGLEEISVEGEKKIKIRREEDYEEEG